jgi:hypothetical protein
MFKIRTRVCIYRRKRESERDTNATRCWNIIADILPEILNEHLPNTSQGRYLLVTPVVLKKKVEKRKLNFHHSIPKAPTLNCVLRPFKSPQPVWSISMCPYVMFRNSNFVRVCTFSNPNYFTYLGTMTELHCPLLGNDSINKFPLK